MGSLIRPAREDEAPLLSAVALASKRVWGYSPDLLEAWRAELTIEPRTIRSRPVMVAEQSGQIAGFYALADRGVTWELDHLWVAPLWMRRGIGRALVEHALATARAGGAWIVTVDSDPHAEAFYRACGAVRQGEVPAPIPGVPDRVRPQLAFTGPPEAPIEIVPYEETWPRRFEDERQVLERALASWLAGPIEHVGSTAVPGLAAKPVIDIMAGVASLADSKAAIAALRPLEYLYAPYRSDVMHWFCKPSPALRTHHLHLVPYESALWNERIAFRDRLRADADLASQYARLKQDLASVHRTDREAYTAAKGPFIASVLRR